MSITIKTRGLTQMRTFVSAADNVPIEAFPIIVRELRTIGVKAGKGSIRRTTGKGAFKNTGLLYDSFTGLVSVVSKEHMQVEIGSDLEYAKFTAVDTGPIHNENENVQLMPHPVRLISGGYVKEGMWRFIGTRPEIKGHPFMEDSIDKMKSEFGPTVKRSMKNKWLEAGQKGRGAPDIP